LGSAHIFFERSLKRITRPTARPLDAYVLTQLSAWAVHPLKQTMLIFG